MGWVGGWVEAHGSNAPVVLELLDLGLQLPGLKLQAVAQAALLLERLARVHPLRVPALQLVLQPLAHRKDRLKGLRDTGADSPEHCGELRRVEAQLPLRLEQRGVPDARLLDRRPDVVDDHLDHTPQRRPARPHGKRRLARLELGPPLLQHAAEGVGKVQRLGVSRRPLRREDATPSGVDVEGGRNP